MTRGTWGKPRRTRQTDIISSPVVIKSDDLPRNDLKEINTGVSSSRPCVAQRPATSGGRYLKEAATPAPGFDFRITVPPPGAVLLPTSTISRVDDTTIGIALGSPRLAEPQSVVAETRHSPPSTAPGVGRPPALQRKPSKWRKFGGLFKAKGAMASNVNKPFYQVRGDTEPPSQGSSHSIDYKSRDISGDPPPTGIENTEIWPCLASDPEPGMHQNASGSAKSAPLLQVEIPSVEMERYSVMFGGLLQKNQPSPVNRRSRTLDNVAAKNTEILAPPGTPRRRATSPTRSRSPNFTLFPATPTTKTSKASGSQNLPFASDPLLVNQTLSLESHTTSSAEKNSHATTFQAHNSPETQMSHRTQESVTSFLSSTSFGSDDEVIAFHKIEPVRNYVDSKEPEWEMVNKKTAAAEPKQKPTKVLTIDTRGLGPSSTGTESLSSSPILSPLSALSRRHDKSLSPVGTKTRAFSPVSRQFSPEEDQIPTIEVSIARSVSVSKGNKQVIVPVRPRGDRINHNERLVVRQAKTLQVTDGKHGHRPGNSQDVRIEIV